MNKRFLSLAVLLSMSSPMTMADELTTSANQLCEKLKQCTLEQMGQTEMTPEMRQMIEPMINGMCEAMRAGIEEVPRNHELYQPAVACMQSMAALSCGDFQDEQKIQTAACESYRKRAEQMAGAQ